MAAPDASIHLANLMDDQLHIEQAKEGSIFSSSMGLLKSLSRISCSTAHPEAQSKQYAAVRINHDKEPSQLWTYLEGGSFILRANCAFWEGCGDCGIWYHRRLLLGLVLGASVTAIGYFATHYTDVIIYVAGEPCPDDWIRLASAILFFFITQQQKPKAIKP